MQGLAAVKRHGQVCADGSLGGLTRIGVDAAGQIDGQHECAAFPLTIHQCTGSQPGRAKAAVKPGAIQSIHDGVKGLCCQRCRIAAFGDRQVCQACIVRHGIGRFGVALGQQDGHAPAILGGGAGHHKAVSAVVALAADDEQRPALRKARPQLGVGGQPGVFHHLQIGQAVGVACTLDFLHLRSGHNAVLHNLCLPLSRYDIL